MEQYEMNSPGKSYMGGSSKIATEWRRELRRLWWLLLYPLAFVLTQLAMRYPMVVENVYSNVAFRMISSVVSKIFGFMPFSFVEFLIYALAVLLLAWIVYIIIKVIKKQFNIVKTIHTLITFAIIVAVVMNVFYLFWGLNYYRMPISHSMKLEIKERHPQELANLCVVLASAANTLREELPEDSEGAFALSGSAYDSFKKIPEAYKELGKKYPQFGHDIPPAKPVFASEMLSVAGIAGIFIPFTEEANVNTHQTDLLLLSSAAHESAHLMGIAREDEANFLGYIACVASADLEVKYSGIMLALINSGNALNKISPEAYGQLHEQYSPAVLRDLAAHSAYLEKYEGAVEEAVSKINDSYLKSHGQSDGVMSYGRMVDLLLAYYDKLSSQLS